MTSIGGVSFWQQDQNYWASTQQGSQAQALSSAVINQMFGASTTLASGLASIANQTALDRVNTALTAAVQSALNSTTGSSTAPSSTSPTSSTASSSSSSSSSAASSTAAPIVAAPATGTGTVPLTSGTPLLGLGFLTRGSFTVSDGTYTTTYQSTGTDTVGDLINAINSGAPGNAQVNAWLNGSGDLVINSLNKIDTVSVSGDYAAALGFGNANATFAPVTPPPVSHPVVSSSTSTSGSNASSSSSSSTTGGSSSTGIANNSAFALQTGSTAELLLASSGSAGSLLNILA
jgi:trimeric autotransporter adhesin